MGDHSKMAAVGSVALSIVPSSEHEWSIKLILNK